MSDNPTLDDLVDDADSVMVGPESLDNLAFDNEICVARDDDGDGFVSDTWLAATLNTGTLDDETARRSALADFGVQHYGCQIDETQRQHGVSYVDFTFVSRHSCDARLSDVVDSYATSRFAALVDDIETDVLETKFADFLAAR